MILSSRSLLQQEYTELHTRLYEAGYNLPLDASMDRAIMRVACTILHEKGIESIFRMLRRVCRKGVNNRISVERVFAVIRAAVKSAFPNFLQDQR